jgi:phospholipid/cholesterol/gamma-HCH transport system substrate-binding protein
MTPTRQLLLGAFFVIVLGILGAYTLFLTDFSLFKDRPEIVVHFPEANDLQKGDSVLVAGIRHGRVKQTAYDPEAPLERRITVTVSLDEPLVLREGYEIHIEAATVLGGKHLYIDPGPPGGAPVSTDRPLPGRVRPGPLEGIGKMVADNGPRVDAVLTKLETVITDLEAGRGTIGLLMRDEALAQELKETVTSAKASFANFDALSTDLREGKGVLGRLIHDEALAVKVDAAMADFQQISADLKALTADVRAGKGVLGRLTNDEKLADDVQQAVATIKDISERINRGNGALWTLLEDEELAGKVRDLVEKLDEGTLGKLLTSDELYVKISKIADDVSAAAAALRNAEGTFGKLLMDKALYDEALKALAILTRTLQEYREAAPITAFTSILFAGF